MTLSVERGELVTLEENRCAIDGLKVMRVGEKTFSIVSELVDTLVTIDDERIFDAVLWTMSRCKLVVEGAAAAPVAALLEGASRRRRDRRSSACSAAATSTSSTCAVEFSN